MDRGISCPLTEPVISSYTRDDPRAEWANSLNQYTNGTKTFNGSEANEILYDANGNLLYDGSLTYAWDEENRLIMVSSATWHAELAYDGLSRRIEARD